MTTKKRFRVIQWATGNIGLRSLQAVIEHPCFDLVGLYVWSPEKMGKDAGNLCGMLPVGITATNLVDDIISIDADCVLYMRQGTDADELCRLLASGKNVVTTRGDFHHPPSMDTDLRRRVEKACEEGETSIYSTGSSPGFITEAIALPFLSLQRRLDCLTIDEFADLSSRNSPDMIFKVMGFGAPPETFDEARAEHVKQGFAGTLRQVADAIGEPIERFDVNAEVAVAKRDIEIAAGVLPKGTIAAQRLSIDGYHNGKVLLRQTLNWYCSNQTNPNWNLRETGWRVRVEGDTPLDSSFTFPIKPEEMAATTPGLTAHRAVNAVPALCAAPTGIRTTVDLPQVIPQF